MLKTPYYVMDPRNVNNAYQKVVKYLPDVIRNPEIFAAIYSRKDSMFFEVGDMQGAFWLTEVVLGWKATIHVVLWDEAVRNQHARVREVILELVRLLRLKRLQAFIPIKNQAAVQLAERMTFLVEGVMRDFEFYDEECVDIGIYVFQKEI